MGGGGCGVRVMILDAYITSCSALSSVPSEVFGLLSIYHVVSFFFFFCGLLPFARGRSAGSGEANDWRSSASPNLHMSALSWQPGKLQGAFAEDLGRGIISPGVTDLTALK